MRYQSPTKDKFCPHRADVCATGCENTKITSRRTAEDPDKNIDTEGENILMDKCMKEVPSFQSDSYNSSGATEQISSVSPELENKPKISLLGNIVHAGLEVRTVHKEIAKRVREADFAQNEQGDIKKAEETKAENEQELENSENLRINLITYGEVRSERGLYDELPKLVVDGMCEDGDTPPSGEAEDLEPEMENGKEDPIGAVRVQNEASK